MNENDKKVCAHPGCSCPATDDSKYCSEVCEESVDTGMTTISCDCGHSGCQGDIA